MYFIVSSVSEYVDTLRTNGWWRNRHRAREISNRACDQLALASREFVTGRHLTRHGRETRAWRTDSIPSPSFPSPGPDPRKEARTGPFLVRHADHPKGVDIRRDLECGGAADARVHRPRAHQGPHLHRRGPDYRCPAGHADDGRAQSR